MSESTYYLFVQACKYPVKYFQEKLSEGKKNTFLLFQTAVANLLGDKYKQR